MTNHASPSPKEPWLAVILSTILPGIGQLYAGKLFRGLFFLGIAIALVLLGGWLVLSPSGNIKIAFQLIIGYALFSFFNLFDAHRCARRRNNSQFEQLRKADADPWLAVFLSSIIPGAGHAYQGAWAAAILFFISIVFARLLSSVLPILLPVAVGLLIFCFYHVYTTSPTERETSKKLFFRVCCLLLAANLLSAVLAVSVRSLVAEARFTPSGGMEPTLQVNDRFAVNKLHYRFNAPKRGDVILFQPPEEALIALGATSSEAYVQRIVGLPGDTVEVKDGKVFINEDPLEEPYIKAPATYLWGPETMPREAYFVLGDNRNSSADSHIWGALPGDNIIGRASQVFWPPSRQGVIE